MADRISIKHFFFKTTMFYKMSQPNISRALLLLLLDDYIMIINITRFLLLLVLAAPTKRVKLVTTPPFMCRSRYDVLQ